MHIVLATKDTQPSLAAAHRPALFEQIKQLCQEQNCPVYGINGMAEHLHMVIALNPYHSLEGFINVIREKSTLWIQQSGLFPAFEGWRNEYAAFSYGEHNLPKLLAHIDKQKEYHSQHSFKEELIELLQEHGVPFKEEELFA